MAKVIANMSMSLDGFIAHLDDGVRHLFDWYRDGDVAVPTANPSMTFHTSAPSARLLSQMIADTGALIAGRRQFDYAHGWGDNHPGGAPMFVVTHSVPSGWPRPGSSINFVTDGLESAVAQAKAVAGDKIVGVSGASVSQQLIEAGLVDEIWVNLIPVLLGSGIPFRPLWRVSA